MFEKLVTALERIAAALEAIATGGAKTATDTPAPAKTEAKKAAAPAKKEAPAPAPEPTVAEVDFKTVQQAAIKYVGVAGGKPAFTAFLKKNFGVEKISDAPDRYPEMLAKLTAAIEELENVG